MLFIETGEVEISIDGKLVAILKAGDCVGETGVIERTLRSATATARTMCHVYTLSFNDFWHVVSYYPEVKDVLEILNYVKKHSSMCKAIGRAMRWILKSDDIATRWGFNRLRTNYCRQLLAPTIELDDVDDKGSSTEMSIEIPTETRPSDAPRASWHAPLDEK